MDVLKKYKFSSQEIQKLKYHLERGKEPLINREYRLTKEEENRAFDRLCNLYLKRDGKRKLEHPYSLKNIHVLKAGVTKITFSGFIKKKKLSFNIEKAMEKEFWIKKEFLKTKAYPVFKVHAADGSDFTFMKKGHKTIILS